ncbi:MAG: hypothetical protein GY757_01265 [bacterium]|nr:hypothetical protein [bacterium]
MQDNRTGWVAGPNGSILKTTDGGHSWHKKEPGGDLFFRCVYFTDSKKGWATGGNRILKTTNGEDWVNVISNATISLHFQAKKKTGWMVGDAGLILKTTDGGNSWIRIWVKPGRNKAFLQLWEEKLFQSIF